MDLLFDTEKCKFSTRTVSFMLSGLSGVQRTTRSVHMRLVAVYKSQERRNLLGLVVPSSTEDI